MRVRAAAVAGTFYPAEETSLRAMVDEMLADAAFSAKEHHAAEDRRSSPKALIVPHAGYIYSGPIAATAFALLAQAQARPSRVVLIGPAHRISCPGMAWPEVEAFDTPLGRIGLDEISTDGLRITDYELSHRAEHSLEVELPFLIRTLGSFRLVPLVAGDTTEGEVAAALDALWGGPETVVVVSSDLSHYLSYDDAKSLDERTARAVLAGNPDSIGSNQACGATCVRALMTVAQRRGLQARLLDLRSSGDTAGCRYDKVVGYGSFAFYE